MPVKEACYEHPRRAWERHKALEDAFGKLGGFLPVVTPEGNAAVVALPRNGAVTVVRYQGKMVLEQVLEEQAHDE